VIIAYQIFMVDSVNGSTDDAELLFCPFDGESVTNDLISLVGTQEFKDFVKYELLSEIR
jgi:hypothetical protein